MDWRKEDSAFLFVAIRRQKSALGAIAFTLGKLISGWADKSVLDSNEKRYIHAAWVIA
ncbi:MAG: hypothetical protein KME49_29340 [Brasilonema octagenarum HA4186-MV1]|uniref:hypothetical protein n=1 Tax=Brasilonema TaxID=383614 RepID=UPI00145CAE4E|nr:MULTISPECIES: hypothetical protein [Brasilonema]MBW4629506.1 hypothetical protein [Brasilonema octagenarum HA4186-MV1]